MEQSRPRDDIEAVHQHEEILHHQNQSFGKSDSGSEPNGEAFNMTSEFLAIDAQPSSTSRRSKNENPLEQEEKKFETEMREMEAQHRTELKE